MRQLDYTSEFTRFVESHKRNRFFKHFEAYINLTYITSTLALFQRFRRLVGIDKAVFYSVLSRSLGMAGSLISVPLVLTRLNPVEQGFYYTFGSILALQVFLEMGFSTVAIQMVAHEAAHLKMDLTSGISGPTLNLDRFSATIRFVRNWYAVLSLLVGLLLFPAGFWFFSTSTNDPSVTWQIPWGIMIFAAAGGVFVNSLSAIIEGMGFVAESIRFRLWGGTIQILVTIAGLLVGFRLYAVPLASAIALIINLGFAWRLSRNVFLETSKHGKEIRIDWIKEVLPFQWRIALSWMSGWFVFNAMLPVVFRQLGAEEAGRFGLAISISNFVGMLATNWISTKRAIFGQMVSRKEWKAMDSLFWKVMPQAVGVAILTSATAILIVSHLAEWVPRFSGRVPEWQVLLMLCSVKVMNQIVIAEAFYLRAHKREPFLANSIFAGVAMAIGLFGFSHSSAFSITAMYAILTFVGLILGSIIFIYCRSRWHRPELITKNELYGNL